MTTTPADEHVNTLTFVQFAKTVNGFEEIAVARAFGNDMEALGKVATARSLVFLDRKRHHGENDATAYLYAMGLTLDELHNYFPDEQPEPVEVSEADAPGEALPVA